MATRQPNADALLPPGSRFCRCATCGEHFLNVAAFERHRVGEIGTRSCAGSAQMRDRGLAYVGGRWRIPRRQFDRARRAALEAAGEPR